MLEEGLFTANETGFYIAPPPSTTIHTMKNTLLIVLSFMLFAACDDPPYEPDYSMGKVSMLKNDVPWLGEGWGFYSGGVLNRGNLLYAQYDELGAVQQSFSFRDIPLEVGTHKLFDERLLPLFDTWAICVFSEAVPEALSDVYYVDESSNTSSITITSYDAATRFVTGTFDIKLYINPSRPKFYLNNPDTIFLTSGEFEVTFFR